MKNQRVILLSNEMDESWDALSNWVEGITDKEYFWKPVQNCWTVHLNNEDQWIVDYETPEPDPPPFTTIAWKLVHLASCKIMYHEYAFGEAKLTWDDLQIPHNSTNAVSWLGEAHYQLRKELDHLEESDLEEMRPTNWGDTWQIWRIFWAMICHDLHHGAEIGCLRDLYRLTHNNL